MARSKKPPPDVEPETAGEHPADAIDDVPFGSVVALGAPPFDGCLGWVAWATPSVVRVAVIDPDKVWREPFVAEHGGGKRRFATLPRTAVAVLKRVEPPKPITRDELAARLTRALDAPPLPSIWSQRWEPCAGGGLWVDRVGDVQRITAIVPDDPVPYLKRLVARGDDIGSVYGVHIDNGVIGGQHLWHFGAFDGIDERWSDANPEPWCALRSWDLRADVPTQRAHAILGQDLARSLRTRDAEALLAEHGEHLCDIACWFLASARQRAWCGRDEDYLHGFAGLLERLGLAALAPAVRERSHPAKEHDLALRVREAARCRDATAVVAQLDVYAGQRGKDLGLWAQSALEEGLRIAEETEPDHPFAPSRRARHDALLETLCAQDDGTWASASERARAWNVRAWRTASTPGVRAARRALKEVERALAGSPYLFAAHDTKVRLLLRLGNTDDAYAVVRWMEATSPGFPDIADLVASADYRRFAERHPAPAVLTWEDARAAAVAGLLGDGLSAAFLAEASFDDVDLDTGRIGDRVVSAVTLDAVRRWLACYLLAPGLANVDRQPLLVARDGSRLDARAIRALC